MKIVRFRCLAPITRHGRTLPKGTEFWIKKTNSRAHVDRWLAEGKIHELPEKKTDTMHAPLTTKKPSRRMTPEKRAELVAAQRARWRKIKGPPESPAEPLKRAVPATTAAPLEANIAALEEVMRAAVQASGCKNEAAFRKLPKEEQNAFLAQARGAKASPARGAGATAGLQLLDPATVRRSPFNREDFDREKLDDLIEDVKLRGVVQPGIVRPVRPAVGKIAWEVIAGERRWLAASAAKVLYPATVQDVDDTAAMELQAVENLTREDLNAIDEARKYRQLLDAYGREGLTAAAALERLEARIGKKRAAIYERLTLLKLPSQTQVLAQRGTLPASHAGLLAKLSDPAAVVRLSSEIVKPSQRQSSDREGERGVLNFRETKRLVDDELEREKRGADYNRERERFMKSHDLILSDAENKKLYPQHWNTTPASNSGYRSLEQTCDKDSHYRTYKALIGSKGKHLSPVLSRLPNGGPLIVYPENELHEAVKAAGKLKGRAKAVSEETRVANALKPRRAAFDVALGKVVKEVECALDSKAFWKMFAGLLVRQWRSEPLRRTAKRRGWPKVEVRTLDGMGVDELRGLVTEILLFNDVPGPYTSGWGEGIKAACALCRVTLPAWSGKGEVHASGNAAQDEEDGI